MKVHIPTKAELSERMLTHLAYHKDSDVIHVIWKGYLVALMEWGLLEVEDYHDLNSQLREIGETERREIFIGYPGQFE